MKAKSQLSHLSGVVSQREYSDLELVVGMKDNDPHAGRAFYKAYGEKIHKLVWSLLRSENDHKDVVNAVLLSIVQSIKNLKDPQRLSQWVSSVTVNTVRSEIRKKQVRRRWFVDVEQPEQRLQTQHTRPGDATARILAILRTLKPRHQIVFTLYFIEGYSYSEVAELQGVSETTAKRLGRRSKMEFLKKASRDLVLASYIEGIDENESI